MLANTKPSYADCTPIQLVYPVITDYARSYININLDSNSDFGQSCPVLAPGKDCSLRLTGGWHLVEATQGIIVIEIWEGDTKAPIRHYYKPVPASGRFDNRIRYTPNPGIKRVTIDALLLDPTTRVVSSTPSQPADLPACDLTRVG